VIFFERQEATIVGTNYGLIANESNRMMDSIFPVAVVVIVAVAVATTFPCGRMRDKLRPI